MRNLRTSSKHALSAPAMAVAAIVIIVFVVGGFYSILTLPGVLSPFGVTSETSTASTSINPVPQFPLTSNMTRVYISAGASIGPNNTSFDPSSVTIVIGVNNTVTWINLDTAAQQVVGPTGTFSSGNLAQEGSFSYTFATPGTYAYSNPTFPWETGTIQVLS